MTRAYLNPVQARRLPRLLEAMDAGMRSCAAGRHIGVGAGNMSNFLTSLFDSGAYPPPREQVLALLALPVLTAREARRLAGQGVKVAPALKRDGEGYVALDGAEIERRKLAVEAERAAREAYWLQVEADKYGLPRPGRPLSGMAA